MSVPSTKDGSANTADTSGRVKAPSSVLEGTPDPAMSYGSLDLAMTTPAPAADTPAPATPDKEWDCNGVIPITHSASPIGSPAHWP